MFLELPDFKVIIHWLGIPFIVESSFRGYFMSVMDMDENDIYFDNQELYCKVMNKFSIMEKSNLIK